MMFFLLLSLSFLFLPSVAEARPFGVLPPLTQPLASAVNSRSAEPAMPVGPIRLMGEFVIEGHPGEPVPPLTIYFDGNILRSNEAGDYTITVSEEEVKNGRLDDLSLVICKRLELDFEQGHTLAGIKMKKLEKCSWYKLDREWDAQQSRWTWIITEQEIGEDDYVPEKALIVLISSKHVSAVCDTAHMASNTPHVHGLLPTIVLHDYDHSRNSIKSAIEAIEVQQHAAPQKVEKFVTPNGVECRRFVW
ncbi:MAG: hypothetical protein QG632_333 [Candidatus Dependentiae bacterium]|nr:hypothetical protein [Candidatus Dependentiae bacterium]